MKRIETRPKIDRNNDTFRNDYGLFRLNTDIPDRVMNQTWLKNTNALDIIELNSLNSTRTSVEDIPEYLQQNFNYMNSDLFRDAKNINSVNEEARQKKLFRTENPERFTAYNNKKHNSDNFKINNLQNNNLSSNHPINCFTIIKKHFAYSDTSLDQDHSNIEFTTQIGDVLTNHDKDEKHETITTFDTDVQEKKRMIWIYSFKNKHLLPDNDCNLINISFDTDSSNCSFENISEEGNVSKNVDPSRIPSPIPAVYVPRLDLSAGLTLSTVTEVSVSPSETDRSVKTILNQKPTNNWFINHDNYQHTHVSAKHAPGDVINWLGLSPRNERRKYNDDTSVKFETKLQDLKCSYDKPKSTYQKNTMANTHFASAETQMHKSFKGLKMEDKETCTTPRPEYQKQSVCDDNIKDSLLTIGSIPTELLIPENEKVRKSNNISSCKPKILLNKKPITHSSRVTSPIENLNSNNWILEESGIKQYFVRGHESNVSKKDRFWSKNAMFFMKSPQWDDYLSITETHLSLSLSFDSGLARTTWHSRLMKCFSCFR